MDFFYEKLVIPRKLQFAVPQASLILKEFQVRVAVRIFYVWPSHRALCHTLQHTSKTIQFQTCEKNDHF